MIRNVVGTLAVLKSLVWGYGSKGSVWYAEDFISICLFSKRRFRFSLYLKEVKAGINANSEDLMQVKENGDNQQVRFILF